MPRLSNLFGPRDEQPAAASSDAGHITIRRVDKSEIEPALRLILLDSDGLAGDDAVLDFLGFAMQRDLDLTQTLIAQRGPQILWAMLPIVSPGRTMLGYAPARIPTATPPEAVRGVVEAACEYWSKHDVHLAQFLIDPTQEPLINVYSACRFQRLAELVYLHRTFRTAPPKAELELPSGFALLNYDESTHAGFARAILDSYESSLDCPALNGVRDVEDIIAGHKSAGTFDPSMWHLLSEHGEPRGVLVLASAIQNGSVELVYLGLSPKARGRGLGETMMKLAISEVGRAGRTELSLAVDSRNTPALKLYYRQGMKRIGSRLALLRDLRTESA